MPGKWKMYATICMTGCIFLGQVNSRPGPWSHLTLDTMAEMRAKKREYWTATKGHKQLSVRGAHGAYMCPGVVEASRLYESMRGRAGNEYWLTKAWGVAPPTKKLSFKKAGNMDFKKPGSGSQTWIYVTIRALGF